ncbi:restriction endonuclease [Actinomadura viridis]|uniref:Restriction system protein n=1 Tax=Actinomadura viridis TaxID=58110 RepID=A0A931GN55_9ACTN|nr:restriction endonuclease [Actinomadura viridis]MBG6086074.1 restriction system protein [Actinomadura viridis]
MPIPDYQTLMAPVLALLADGQELRLQEVRDRLAPALGISEEERQERINSGTPRFDNRVHWAVTYLYQAGLLQRPRRGVIQITDRGSEVLKANPERVDNEVLNRFEDFRAFKSRTRPGRSTPAPTEAEGQSTPQEKISSAIEEANEAVAAEVLERVQQADFVFLERLVLRVLAAMGYGGPTGSIRHLGGPGDGGVDGVIRQDPLGLDEIYVQAKRFATHRTIGRPEIQAFVGALHGAQADRGIFVTTSSFTADATDYADRVNARVVLIDGAALARLMVQHNIGVQDQERYVLKRVDEDFFEEL